MLRPIIKMGFISRTSFLFIFTIAFLEILLIWRLFSRDVISNNITRYKFSIKRFDFPLTLRQQERDTVSSFIQSHATSHLLSSLIHVAVVVCGERTGEATTMLKSTTMFTKSQLFFHILAEDERHSEIKSIIDEWPPTQDGQVDYKMYSLEFPSGKSSGEWKRLFKPCATQRLFLPSVLKHIDALLYLDTDCLVLRPIEDVWQHFNAFNSTQLAAVSPEGEVPGLNWYKMFARHPYYGQLGINSGVMLMNLTRMRAFGWENTIMKVYERYKLNIAWGDQDILNILFHFYPELLYVISCEWNYRSEHCKYGSNCKTVEVNGISILHGSRGIFHYNKQPVFRAVYDAIKAYHHGDDSLIFLDNLRNELEKYKDTYCGALKSTILRHPSNTINII